jgi:excisionase family DNA binding protein
MTDAQVPGPVPDRLLYPVRETAQLLGLGESTVWGMVKNGRLCAVRVGKRTLIPRREIDRIAGGET